MNKYTFSANPGSLQFISGGETMLEIKPSGEFFVRGKLAATDLEVFETFSKWLALTAEANKNLARQMNALAVLPELVACLKDTQKLLDRTSDLRYLPILDRIDAAIVSAIEGQR
jgi:hypothetical protein